MLDLFANDFLEFLNIWKMSWKWCPWKRSLFFSSSRASFIVFCSSVIIMFGGDLINAKNSKKTLINISVDYVSTITNPIGSMFKLLLRLTKAPTAYCLPSLVVSRIKLYVRSNLIFLLLWWYFWIITSLVNSSIEGNIF